MAKELRFDGRVAIVTGAGGGLGKAHALLLASRGAKVVVNDLGGSFTGEGKSASAADRVVEEIRSAGGEAVANYDSVEDGAKIVETAMKTFGRLDIVVNNAGILRDVSFQKMTDDDWEKIYRVHVLGTFRVTHAAWPILREQGYGRVIVTASAAGIYGNFGQANYAAAKLGLFGFASTLALEGRKKNILVNTIAPIAGSRMTETVLPPEMIAALKPEYVSPLVARLVHEESEETGSLFEVGGGFFAKLRWERAKGKLFRVGRQIRIEDVDQAWDQITSFENAEHPDSVAASMQPILANVEKGPSQGGNDLIDVDESLGFEFPPIESSYDERDLAVYALGVGAARDPLDTRDLQLVYEMHSGGMKALPTYGVVPAISAILDLAKKGIQPPGMHYGLDRILHGEQYTEVLRPLPTNAKLTHKARVKHIWDKGKGAVVVTEVKSYDEHGEELIRNDVTMFIRGAGGWGGERGPSSDINNPPARAPDAVVQERIPENAALLYRLSGDWNPLHADPEFAMAVGFQRPILHGLCSFGYAGRHVISKFAPEGNPDFFKSIQARFAETVYPGETLVTEMWKESDTRIVFRCKIAERDKVAISNAAIELFKEVPKPKSQATAQPTAAKSEAAAPAEPLSADIFGAIDAFLKANAEVVGKVKTVYQFKLSAPASVWTVDAKNAGGGATPGETQKPQCTLSMSDGDFLAMCTGKADAMKLFTSGKMKISGDVLASQKLEFLRKIPPDLVIERMKARGAAPAGKAEAQPQAETAADASPTSWDVFVAIRDHVGRHPELAQKIQTVFVFKLADPPSAWTVDLKNGKGSVEEGETKKADCTLAITEANFLDMTSGKADSMKLFTSGKLKISGNVMASQKLNFLQKIDKEEAKAAVMRARAAGAAGKSAAASQPAGAAEANAPKVFAALAQRLAENPKLKDEVQAVVQFRVKEPEGAWVADFSSPTPAVQEGTSDKATATLTLNDGDLGELVRGEASAQDLFQHGKLRADGDVTVAHRLGFLKGLA